MKNNWQTKTLGEIGNIFSGNSINEKVKKTKYLNIKEGMPYVATKDISYENEISYENGIKIPEKDLDKFRIAHKNSVFICAEGGSAGRKLAFNIKDVCFVNKLFAFESKEIIEPKFIYYFYQSDDFQKQFKSRLTGLIGGVSMSKFKDINVSYPNSLETQKQIVKILDEVFESISKSKENAEKNLKNAKELFESYLEEIFSNPRDGWEEKKLGEVCEINPKKSEIKDLSPNEIVSFLPMSDLEVFQKNTIPKEIRKLSEVVGSYTYFSENDILLAKVTPCFENGKLGIAKDLKNGIGFGSSEYIVFRPLCNVSSEYIFYLLSSAKFRNEGKKLMFGACGLKRLSKDYVQDFLTPLPPISEQKAIVQKLDDLSAEIKQLEEIYSQKLKDLEELKKSMLQKAFSGELTKE